MTSIKVIVNDSYRIPLDDQNYPDLSIRKKSNCWSLAHPWEQCYSIYLWQEERNHKQSVFLCWTSTLICSREMIWSFYYTILHNVLPDYPQGNLASSGGKFYISQCIFYFMLMKLEYIPNISTTYVMMSLISVCLAQMIIAFSDW